MKKSLMNELLIKELEEYARKYGLAEEDLVYSIVKSFFVLAQSNLDLEEAIMNKDVNYRLEKQIMKLKESTGDVALLLNRLKEKGTEQIAVKLAESVNPAVLDELIKESAERIRHVSGLSWKINLLWLFVAATFFGFGHVLGQKATVRALVKTQDLLRVERVRRGWEFLQKNPELQECTKPGWIVEKREGKKVCFPKPDKEGDIWGWIL